MNRIVGIIITVALLSSCKEDEAIYQGTYDQGTFVSVLRDLFVAEAALKDLNATAKDSVRLVYRNQIEQIHEVDMSIVEAEFEKIQSQPNLYKKIQEAISDSIVMMEKQFNTSTTKTIPKPKSN